MEKTGEYMVEVQVERERERERERESERTLAYSPGIILVWVWGRPGAFSK